MSGLAGTYPEYIIIDEVVMSGESRWETWLRVQEKLEEKSMEDKLDLYNDLIRYLERGGKSFKLDGPLMATVVLNDGTWRKRTLEAAEYFMTDVREGKTKRGHVFQFMPEDGFPTSRTPFEQKPVCVEFTQKELDKAFPLMIEDARKWAIERFCKDGDPESQQMKEIFEKTTEIHPLLCICVGFEVLRAKTVKEEEDEILRSNPLFGMF